jgi:hypothetical protein
MTFSASKEKRAGGGPLPQHGAFAGSTMAPAASEPSRYPRRRSRVYLFPDRPQVRERRPDGRPVPLLRSPRSLRASSRVVMGRAAYLRTRGVKTDQKPTPGLPKAPGRCRSLEVLPRGHGRADGLGNGPTCFGKPDVSRRRTGGAGCRAWLGGLGPLPELVGTGFRGRVDLASAAAVAGLGSTAFELLENVLHRLVVADRVGNPAVVVVACDNDGAVVRAADAEAALGVRPLQEHID